MVTIQLEGVEHPDLDLAKIERWISMVAAAHGCRPGRISYMFCNDDYVIEQNRQFLGHDYFTDIITFDYSRGDKIAGDILISLDTVRSNAGNLGLPYEQELLRVVIHGVLHLCGIDDKGPGEREIMEKAENEALALYPDA